MSYHDRIHSREEPIPDDHTLEFLLGFDGRIHYLAQGYWLKFEVRRIDPTPERPHGLRYSLTPHDPSGQRLIGFDNAHGVPPRGSHYQGADVAYDHWHRGTNDEGRPYRFTTVVQLIDDFEAEVERVLTELGISNTVIGTGERNQRGSP